ncbi:MAG: hypothetical protein ACTS78_01615 [Arsenophonus sp. NC-WZS1-MAG3]
MAIHLVLTDRFVYENVQLPENMNLPVCCAELDIEHRFITPMYPEINGMIE